MEDRFCPFNTHTLDMTSLEWRRHNGAPDKRPHGAGTAAHAAVRRTFVLETRKLSTSTARSLSAIAAPPFKPSVRDPVLGAGVGDSVAPSPFCPPLVFLPTASGVLEAVMRSSETLRSLVTSSESLDRALEIIPSLA